MRTYKRKTENGTIPPEVIRQGVQKILEGGKFATVAREMHIPRSTLKRYTQKFLTEGGTSTNDVSEVPLENFIPRYKTRKIFTAEEEKSLENYLIRASQLHHGLSTREVRKLAFDFAEKLGKDIHHWEEAKTAGKDWLWAFLHRNPTLSLRSPEATSIARATAFNRPVVNAFFDTYESLLRKYSFSACDVWNLDETGPTTVQNPRKIVAEKGKKQVGRITSGERGVLVTMCTAVSAQGIAIPQFMIFPRVKYLPHMMKGSPPGSVGVAHPSGWMTGENFVVFLEHFIRHSKPSVERPVLLLMDNHTSHVTIESLELMKKSRIIVLTFPPHTSHKLQPLDRSCYGPFKAYYNAACDTWMTKNPGKSISIYDVAELVGTAFPRALTPTNITSGFRVAGIWPCDRFVFADEVFLAAEVTDRLDPSGIAQRAGSEMFVGQDSGSQSQSEPSSADLQALVGSTSAALRPEVVRPYPKAPPEKGDTIKRKKGRSEVLTDTPVKNALIEEL